jgi:hypothetical protein
VTKKDGYIIKINLDYYLEFSYIGFKTTKQAVYGNLNDYLDIKTLEIGKNQLHCKEVVEKNNEVRKWIRKHFL